MLSHRYNCVYKISFFIKMHFRKKHFYKHYTRFTHLLITRFLNSRHYVDIL